MSDPLTFSVDWSQLNRPQQDFLLDMTEVVCLSAGFGTGKTTAEAVKVLQLATANPGVPGMIAAQSETALERTILMRLRMLTGLDLPMRQGRHGRSISLDGVTPIYCATADGYKYADGTDVGWFVGDEARHWPVKAWDVFKTRARIPCKLPQTAIGTTPMIGWLSNEFDSNLPGHSVVFGSTIENEANLSKNYVSNLMGAWSKRMQKAALHGQFVIMEGAVFESFEAGRDSPWVIDYDAERWRSQPAQLWIDPGYRRSAVIWVREHPTEPLTWVVFDQDMIDNAPMTRVVAHLNAKARANRLVIGDIVVDPAAKQVDQATEINLRQVIRQIQRVGKVYHLTGFFRGIEWGIERVRALLGDPEIGLPQRILFSRELAEKESQGYYNGRGIMRSLAGTKYPEEKDRHALSEKPEDHPLFKHAVDAARYGGVLLWLRNTQLRKMLLDVSIEKGPGYATL